MQEKYEDEYDIVTEDGKMFCKCIMNEGNPVFTSKQGSLPLTFLLEQAFHPKMSGKRKQSRNRGMCSLAESR